MAALDAPPRALPRLRRLFEEAAPFGRRLHEQAIVRLGGAETPIPYSPILERAAVPQVDDILQAARKLAGGRI